MRKLLLACGVLAACHVPDKTALVAGDANPGGGDAGWSGSIDTMITSGPGEFSNSASAHFEFDSNAPGATFMCSVDGDSPAACTSPIVKSLPDGTHMFAVHAVLGDQQDDTPAEAVATIDTGAPATTITQGPPPADNSTNVMFFFQSNEMNVTFDCSLDNAAYAPCNSGDSFGPLADGAHAFAVRAHDRAGNVDASPAIAAWTTDTSTPDTQILSGPMGQSGSQSATFTFASPHAGPGVTNVCALDSPIFIVCTSPDTLNNLTEGSHTFQVRVRSSAGTVDPSPAPRTWSVDLPPPDTPLTSGPYVTFAFTTSEGQPTCAIDGGAFAPCTAPVSMNLNANMHSFAVKATDGAGNTATATRTW